MAFGFYFFHETINSHNFERANHITHIIFVLHSTMETHLLTIIRAIPRIFCLQGQNTSLQGTAVLYYLDVFFTPTQTAAS